MTSRRKQPADAPTRLSGILRTLAGSYGKPAAPAVTDPLAQILFENVAYLASDERRAEAFRLLRQMTGLEPERPSARLQRNAGPAAPGIRRA